MTGVREMERFEAAYRGLDAETQLRLDLVVAHRWGARWGWHEGVVNHLTALLPGVSDRFLAIPYGIHWSEVKPADFLTVDLNGRILAGQGEIELTSLLIHGAMHRELCQARVILHTHQPNINWLTCLEDQTLEMCSQHALHFAGRIAYLNSFGLATEASIGTLIHDALQDRDILLMANHGVTVCGPAVHEAFDDLYTLDRACQIQSMALASRRPLRTISPGDVAVMFPAARAKAKEEGEMHFRALRRILWREEPELV
jgi:ribulose-5-phosphate 4-epimerase/fuculose-1-phosphate aldolase